MTRNEWDSKMRTGEMTGWPAVASWIIIVAFALYFGGQFVAYLVTR